MLLKLVTIKLISSILISFTTKTNSKKKYYTLHTNKKATKVDTLFT